MALRINTFDPKPPEAKRDENLHGKLDALHGKLDALLALLTPKADEPKNDQPPAGS